MQRSLLSRLENLERRDGTGGGTVIFRTIVSPGPNGPIHEETLAVQSNDGWRLERRPGERTENFRERAAAVVPRNTWGCASLLEVTA